MERSKKLHGVLLLDKPVGITSHDVVARVRKILDQKEVGHTGTLDPLASGLMVICLGRATKVTQFLTEEEKSYCATVRFGSVSTTYDAEGIGPDDKPTNAPLLLDSEFKAVISKFKGLQSQQVPPHASVRLNGRHMYDMTRKGEVFERPFRDVTIISLKASSYNSPDLVLEVHCSKGTYIRSLAHDLGQAVGCGAYLADLRRTSVGRFDLKDAVSLDQLAELKSNDQVADRLLPISQVLDFSTLVISDVTSDHVLHGQLPCWSDVVEVEGDFRTGDTVLLRDAHRGALAIAIAASDSKSTRIPTERSVESFVRVLA